jgi:AcrR family transcriptional regulator
MEQADLERTLFYRQFDDLGDLLRQAAREAFEALYETELDLGPARAGAQPDAVRAAIEPAARVYQRHGPLLRALSEAAAGDEQIAAGQAAMRRRFDDLVTEALGDLGRLAAKPASEVAETARALNLMNEAYLLEAFGREPRVTVDAAVRTLSEVWLAVIHGRGQDGGG